MLITLTVILALAIGVLVVLLLTRRSVSDWQVHLSETTSEWKKRNEEGEQVELVEPRKASLEKVLREESRSGSAYLTADELPKFDNRHDSPKK